MKNGRLLSIYSGHGQLPVVQSTALTGVSDISDPAVIGYPRLAIVVAERHLFTV